VLLPMQAGIDTFMNRISGLEGDKAGLEEQLRRTHHMVTCLQVSALYQWSTDED
jgi:hypothetical protein